ncbi:hypothetical protein EZJ44_06610 [Arcanobacterium bovis]|uniref:Uncharacterized protein n=2 Tax=Arcanobacterium bovis TaxID=2529275 RepID=A0A4Q9V1R5_9ACTO|nr:hypothetical protein EZJ44_06610 [Arcanobacterium bovis]
MTASQALRNATLEIEKHVAGGGWDGPIRLFALVKARAALDLNPALAEELPADVKAESISDPDTLFSVEQEDLPKADSLNELLGQIMWPEEVDGAAISVERIVLPPSAEVNLPEDEVEAQKVLQSHPDRQDVRMVAAVLRSGETWSAIRMKDHDADDMVLSGSELVQGLSEALKMTFE